MRIIDIRESKARRSAGQPVSRLNKIKLVILSVAQDLGWRRDSSACGLRMTGRQVFLQRLRAASFVVVLLSAGCVARDPVEQAQEYVQRSQADYSRAIELYRDLILKGEKVADLQYALGRLYYQHGDYAQAVEQFLKSGLPPARRLLAITYYQTADYTDALELFTKYPLIGDDEYNYYHGLTCERLNLYDQAVQIYKAVRNPRYAALAAERLQDIQKESSPRSIRQVSPETADLIEGAAAGETYPQAGAVILLSDERITISSDYTQTSYLRYTVKILNQRGKEDYSESHIEYDSTYEKVELVYARTIKPDGTVVDLGSRHLRDVSKYLNFPLYSNARVFIISFPEIAEGAVIDYALKVSRSQLINKKDFVMAYSIQSGDPILRADFVVEAPESMDIRLRTRNESNNNFGAQLLPRVTKKGAGKIYTWKFNDIPQILPEPNMPPAVEVNPAIIMSTFASWDDVYHWWWPLAKDKIRVDEPIRSRVNDLTRGLAAEEAKARAIYNFCAQKIRYVAVEYGQAGYEPHPAEDVYRNKYGDCKDQAVLLVAMLREAGLKSYPVLIATRDYYNAQEDFPSVLFNHCIAAVMLGDKTVFLDPTAETCAFEDLPGGDQERCVVVFKDDGYEIHQTPLSAASANVARQIMNIVVSPEETISGRKRVYTQGIYDQAQRMWLVYTPPIMIEEALQEKIQEASIGAKLLNYKVSNVDTLDKPIELDYSFTGDEYLTSAGTLRIMPQLASLDTSIVAKQARVYDIDFGVLDTRETVYELQTAENFSLRYLPGNLREDNQWLSLTVEYARLNPQAVRFTQAVRLKQKRIPISEYLAFKTTLESLARKLKQRIVFERKK